VTLWDAVHSFHCPTLVLYGRGVAAQTGERLRELGVARALVVSDAGVRAAGIVDAVAEAVGESGIELAVYAETRPNPTTQNVAEAHALGAAHDCDGVVGLGGGSAMDAAKGAAVVATNGGRIADFTGRDRIPHDPLPLVCVPTTCGTGSEVTFNAVISDEEAGRKLPFVSPRLAPRVALVDPELVERAPGAVIASTGADALAHAVESYINLAHDPLIDALCIAAIRLIARNLREAVHERAGDAVDAMTIAATMAGIAFNQNANAIVHAAATPVTAHFGVPHGIANAVFMPAGLEFCLPACRERLADVAEAFERPAVAEEGVVAIRELLLDVGLPATLRELGVDPEVYEARLPSMVEDAMKSRSIPLNPRPVEPDDVERLYRAVIG
jgi:alcohol dehydrogenase class IV